MRKPLLILIAGFFVCSGIFVFSSESAGKDPKAFFEETCSQCHSIDIPKNEKMTKDDWAYTVGRMRNNGLSISDQEAEIIVNYLVENHGKK